MVEATSSNERFPELAFLSELLPVEPVSMLVQELETFDGAVPVTYIVCGAVGTHVSMVEHFRVLTIAGGERWVE
jgi:hypothetical protein